MVSTNTIITCIQRPQFSSVIHFTSYYNRGIQSWQTWQISVAECAPWIYGLCLNTPNKYDKLLSLSNSVSVIRDIVKIKDTTILPPTYLIDTVYDINNPTIIILPPLVILDPLVKNKYVQRETSVEAFTYASKAPYTSTITITITITNILLCINRFIWPHLMEQWHNGTMT